MCEAPSLVRHEQESNLCRCGRCCCRVRLAQSAQRCSYIKVIQNMLLSARFCVGAQARAAGTRLAAARRTVRAFSSEEQAGDEDKALRFKSSNRRAPIKVEGDSKNLINAMSGVIQYSALHVSRSCAQYVRAACTCRAFKRTPHAFQGDYICVRG